MTRSTALLSGFERIGQTTVLPDSIDLPAAWSKAFVAMAERTGREKHELGACLSLGMNAGLEKETEQALKDYQALAIGFARQPRAEFNVAEAKLRAQVDAALTHASTSGLEWLVGTIQSGGDQSVDIKFTTALCDASALGHVHTHPAIGNATAHTPSDGDLVNRLVYAPGFFSAVVDRDGVCVLLTGERNPRERMREGPFYSGHVHRAIFTDLLSEVLPPAPPGNDALALRIERSAGVFGRIAEDYGGALYCGAHGESLKRQRLPHPPAGSKAGESSTAAMAVKATLAIARWRYYPEWPRMEFAWNDRDDPAVYRYVAGLKLHGGGSLVEDRTTIEELVQQGPVQLLYRISGVLWSGDENPTVSWLTLVSPDLRRASAEERRQESLRFNPQPYDGAWSYEIIRVLHSEDTVGQRLAWTEPGGADWSLVQREGSGFRETEWSGGTLLDGPVVERGGRWVREGNSIVDGPESRFEGEFTDGQPTGPGRILRKKDNTWLRALRGPDGKLKIDGTPAP